MAVITRLKDGTTTVKAEDENGSIFSVTLSPVAVMPPVATHPMPSGVTNRLTDDELERLHVIIENAIYNITETMAQVNARILSER